MKILILQDRLRSGGTERQSILFARAFREKGHETLLLTFRPGGMLSKDLIGIARQSLQPVDFHLDWFAPGLTARVAGFSPDILLCMGRMANCYGGWLQRRFPKTVVVATLRTGKPLPGLFRRSLKIVRHIIANSREARDFLVKRHAVPAERVSVVHNSLVFPERSEGPSNLRAQFGAGPKATVLLSVAMFRPEKNQRELIEIAAGLPKDLEWQLWLAGEGPALAECQALAGRLGLTERVKFPGFFRDPSALYLSADVAVHASSSESLSNFLIEAQAHGLPAVAYSAQGISECFIPGKTGWEIARGDAAAFQEAVVRLAGEDPRKKSIRSEEARAFAKSAFNPETQVDATLEIFSRLRAEFAKPGST